MSNSWIKSELKKRTELGLYRELRAFDGLESGSGAVNFSSNDYLNLSRVSEFADLAVKAVRDYGTSFSSSRLVTGTTSLHADLEKQLAEFLNVESCLVTGTGYLANLSAVTTLVGRGDVVVADKFVHASLIDGIVLSRAEFLRFEHNSLDHLKQILTSVDKRRSKDQKVLVVTESVFSMDGDKAPLAEIARLAEEHNAMLLVDEAHALGVFGDGGSGLINELGISTENLFITATLSKAFASYGGIVAGSDEFIRLCINKARAFIYNTALPPASVGAAIAAVSYLRNHKNLGSQLLKRADFFRGQLKMQGLETANSDSHIIPVVVGSSIKALDFADRLRNRGILVVAIRPPTVPENTSRIRFSVTLAHTEEQLADAAKIIAEEYKLIK